MTENEANLGVRVIRSLNVCHTLVSLFSSETALIVSVSSFSWSRHWLSSSWASYRWTGVVKYNLSIGSMCGRIKVPLWATFAILGYGYVKVLQLNVTTSHKGCNWDGVPLTFGVFWIQYRIAGSFRGSKLVKITIFAEKTFTDCSL